jgi:hypothetical protein
MKTHHWLLSLFVMVLSINTMSAMNLGFISSSFEDLLDDADLEWNIPLVSARELLALDEQPDISFDQKTYTTSQSLDRPDYRRKELLPHQKIIISFGIGKNGIIQATKKVHILADKIWRADEYPMIDIIAIMIQLSEIKSCNYDINFLKTINVKINKIFELTRYQLGNNDFVQLADAIKMASVKINREIRRFEQRHKLSRYRMISSFGLN